MIRTIVLFSVLTGILLFIGMVFAGAVGVGIALIFALVINFVSYWYSDKIILKLYKAKPLEDERINAMIRNLAAEAGIPKPKIYIIPTEVPNAFACGRSPKKSVVALTRGLLELEKDEVEGVMAHELAHIKNRDVLVATLVATIAGAISFLAQIGYWSLFFGGQRRGEGNVIGLFLIIIFAPIAALLIRLAVSRSRELKADYMGALISKNPEGLSSALKRISNVSKRFSLRGSSATSHMWIVNPFRTDWFTGLFSTHPPLAIRIERLESFRIKK
ncbi:MAG: zinc metalloprotease HtpX [Candidatus Aenigmarchaeota archaeon]|nr:zinc metalloprotease HtpX [Candidatus Aenigmarchaeota archaeon]